MALLLVYSAIENFKGCPKLSTTLCRGSMSFASEHCRQQTACSHGQGLWVGNPLGADSTGQILCGLWNVALLSLQLACSTATPGLGYSAGEATVVLC